LLWSSCGCARASPFESFARRTRDSGSGSRARRPFEGTYFRSVEYRYMDPEEVLNGAGTAALGGRFAPVGAQAVYLNATDSGTGAELLARKARLGGSPQITLDKYPRVVFGVEVKLNRSLNLATGPISAAFADLRQRSLLPDELETSMKVAAALISANIQGVVFPNVVGGTENLVVYLANCGAAALRLHNADELITKARRIAEKPNPR
jgi:RES domain-containing protein